MTDQQLVTQKGNRIDDNDDYINSRSIKQLWKQSGQDHNHDYYYQIKKKSKIKISIIISVMITLGSLAWSETSNQVHNQEK